MYRNFSREPIYYSVFCRKQYLFSFVRPDTSALSSPPINPDIEQAEHYRKDKDGPSVHFHINHLFEIVDDIGTGICLCRIMVRPQPNLEMGQGTVPAKDLEHKRKGQPADMDIFDDPVYPARKRPEDQKNDPEEMNNYGQVSKKPGDHG